MRFATDALEAAGAQHGGALRVARSLVEAERAGLSGHGLARLPGYVARLRAGGTVSGQWSKLRSFGPIESYDGRGGLGHVHLEDAVRRAAELSAEHGVGVVGVSNSNHAGALGPKARVLAKDGFVAILVTNAPAVIAPPGGRRPVVGTNPIAVAAPVPGRPPVVCDLSSSQVSRGQILLAAQTGGPIPPGWALDAEGRPTEDPHAALAGSLAALGGNKGFALAVGIEILTGLLLGPAVGPEVGDFFEAEPSRPQGVAHLVVALDPGRLGDPQAFSDRAARLATAIEEAGDEGSTRVPGSRGPAHEARLGDHLPISADLERALGTLAAELGIDSLEPSQSPDAHERPPEIV